MILIVEEAWKELPYTTYIISNYGKVINNKTGQVIKGSINTHGYRHIAPNNKFILLHTVVCTLFNGSKPEWCKLVRHLDGDKLNNVAWNLAWGTHKENTQDALNHGTFPIGSRSVKAKLTEDKVILIREALSLGMKGRDIAKAFNISPQAISDIKLNHSWKEPGSLPI